MGATADVILSINSKLGPGGMASLQAAGQMLGQLGKKVIANIKEMEKFSQVYQRVEIDISQADAATKGLIDTMALMKNANKITAAQMEITGAQFKDIAVLATNMAKKMGTDATTEMNKLTDAISKGQSRALKAYGIDLEETEDQLLAQAEAMMRVSEQAQGLKIEVETLGEAMFVFGNNTDTTAGLLFDWVSGQKSGDGLLGDINSGMADFNNAIMESNGGVLDYMTSLGGISLEMDRLALDTIQTIGIFGDWTEEIKENDAAVQDLMGTYVDLANSQAFYDSVQRALSDDIPVLQSQKSKDLQAQRDALDEPKKKKKRSGGGGGGRKKQGRQDSGLDEIDFLTDRGLSAAGQEDFGGADSVFAEVDGVETLVKAYEELSMTKRELLSEEYELTRNAQMDAIETSNIKLELLQQDDELRRAQWEESQIQDTASFEFEKERQEWWAETHEVRISGFAELLGIEQQYVNESHQMWESGLQGKLRTSQIFFSSIGKLQNVESRKAFAVAKAAAYSENIITTALASMKAFSAMSGIPIVGPALGAVAAIAVGISGAAAGAKIRSATFGGGGGGGGSSGGKFSDMSIDAGSKGLGGGGVPGGPAGGGGGEGGTTEITVVLTGGIEGWMDAAIEEDGKRDRHNQPTLSGGNR